MIAQLRCVPSPGLVCDGVQSVSLGSLYAGAVGLHGELLMWGALALDLDTSKQRTSRT